MSASTSAVPGAASAIGALARLLPAALLLAAAVALPAAARADGVSIRFLGNEGFALEAGGRTVLIDALQTVGDAESGHLPPEVHRQLLSRTAPFARVPLVLVSHPHADHHQPQAAAGFLHRRPEALLAATPEVLESLAGEPGLGLVRARLRAVDPRPGTPAVFRSAGIAVEFHAMPHASPEMYPGRVVAHLVTLGGRAVLHASDAELTEESLAPLRLEGRTVDVAILPYWAFLRPGARELVSRHLPGARLVAMRMPLADGGEAQRQIAATFPGVVFLPRPMDRATF